MTRSAARGFTLIELMVAVAIMSMVSVLIYSAFSGLKNSKEGIERVDDRYREGRLAMARISRELQSAYLSAHAINPQQAVQQTAFIGTRGTPADRVDFNSFSNRRLDRDSHESDQVEISYFGSRDPKRDSKVDLVRRADTKLDEEPQKGGRIEVLATDIDLFDLEYLDPLSGQWVETWDSTQAAGQPQRMPLQVRVILVLNEGRRSSRDRSRATVRFVGKYAIPIQKPLTFATQ
ncbi:MAG TPA: prepilin-type N-terminal cleavage/methylation domain-containing protein [Polyangiaceae bacterium]